VLVLSIGWVNSAGAAYLRGTASLCTPTDFTAALDHIPADAGLQGEGNILCPYVEFDDFDKMDVVTLNVYVEDGDSGDNALAGACWADFSGTSYDCGSLSTTGAAANTGLYTLSVDVSTWDTLTGHAYIFISLPTDSTLEGYYASS
jgi:hypothetical protein